MARIGELLLAEKVITPDQLQEALEAQVVHGGRLGTNLVELGFLKETDLARVLGRQHNMPFAAGEMLPDAQAVKVADADFYDDAEVLPMRVDQTRLTVAVMSPGKPDVIDTLQFRAGRRVMQVIIPEFRMNQLLRKYAKAFRPMRPIDMNTLRPSKKKDDGQPRPADVGDLINEDDFASLYAKAVGGVAEEEAVIEGVVLEDEAPVVAGTPVPGTQAVAPPAPRPVPRPSPEPLQDPEQPPLNFAEAQALLANSSDREDIARIVLRFARSKFRRAILFNVQGDLVTGWQGMGLRVRRKAVVRIGISLREPNSFKLVRDLRSHFVGPMQLTASMEVFYKLLGGKPPATAVLMPLLVRGKPVHLLYLDMGPKLPTPPDVGELLIVSQGVTRSYEALIRQRQAQQHQ